VARADRPTPLPAAFALTVLNSMATGVVTTGVFTITRQGFRFTDLMNNGLGVLQGLAYIAGALAIGPMLTRLQARLPWLTTRGVLLGVLLGLASLCALPSLWHSPAAMWWMIGLYDPLNGALWPIIESYVSGGRSGRGLRRTTGFYCITWSSVIVVAFLAISGFCEQHPREAILLLGGLHLLSIAFLHWFTPRPLKHGEVDHDPHPASYRQLLVVFRWLLPLSYLLQSALSPFLPRACALLMVPGTWQMAAHVGWLLPRAVMFVVMVRAPGWHGRFSHPVQGCAALLLGFVVTVLAPVVGGTAGLWLLFVGLATFGAGMAAIYGGALYYAMEVGGAAVDAGGKFEALIGVGFAGGPLFGLLAAIAVERGQLAADHYELAVLVPASLVTLGIVGMAFAAGRRSRAG
jgi:hypothetical protein